VSGWMVVDPSIPTKPEGRGSVALVRGAEAEHVLTLRGTELNSFAT
jgi:hypothetical protein